MEVHFSIKTNRSALRSLINLSKKNKTIKAIKFECLDNIIKATATNNDFILSCLLEGSIYENGIVYLPTDILDKAMKSSVVNINDTTIKFGEEPDGLFSQGNMDKVPYTQIKSSDFILAVKDDFEFISGKKIQNNQAIELGSALKNASRFLPRDESKTEMNGIFYDHVNHTIASTDGIKLFTQQISFPFVNQSILIPSDAIDILCGHLHNAVANIEDCYLNIQTTNIRYSILLKEQQFPKYQNILPKESDLEKINISARGRQALYESEKLIDSPVMKIDIDERSSLRLTNSDSGYKWEEGEFYGKERTINFHMGHLTHVLALTENVYCNPKNFSASPFVFTKDDIKILLMPTKV